MNLKKQILSTAVKLGDASIAWDYAFDNRELCQSGNTECLIEISSRLWALIKHLNPSVIVGKGVAGMPLLVAIKLEAYKQDGVNLAILFVRDQRKRRGSFKKLVEGPSVANDSRTVFIDDLFNNGDTYEFCKQSLIEDGYNLQHVGAAVLIDFWNGSRKLTAVGFPFFSIYRRHDLGLTRVDSNLPKLLTKLNWRLHVHHTGVNYMPVKSPPVIANDKLYIGNDNGHQYCYSVDTGDLLWKYESTAPKLKGNVCVAQVVADRIFWSAYDGVVRCANADTGSHIWSSKVDLNLHSAPCLDLLNDRLFVGTEFDKQPTQFGLGDIVALSASSGKELWRYHTKNMVPGTPIYIPEVNMVVCGSNDFFVYLLQASTGELIAKVPTKGEVKGKPVYDESAKLIIVESVTGFVVAITLSGEIKWERRVGFTAIHPYPIICESGVIVTNGAHNVVCLDIKTGDVNWITKLRGNVGWGVTDTDAGLLALTTTGTLTLLDKLTGAKIANDKLPLSSNGAICYQPPAYHQSKLVIATNNKGIYCYDVNLQELVR